MEREVMFTGVGGQGVQIASKTLATAAIDEGRQVMLVPRYGGGMRGGMTNAEVTIGDRALRALPVATSAWSAYVMDPTYWETIRPNLAPGAVVVVNSSLFHRPVDVPEARVFEVPASDVAADLSSPMSAGFVLLGAFVAVTGLVTLEGRRHAPTRAGVPDPASRSQRGRAAGRGQLAPEPGRSGVG
jgi:Pyruvate/2-oxoacid:ferredoxin oxidoreductase gamma subunit